MKYWEMKKVRDGAVESYGVKSLKEIKMFFYRRGYGDKAITEEKESDLNSILPDQTNGFFVGKEFFAFTAR